MTRSDTQTHLALCSVLFFLLQLALLLRADALSGTCSVVSARVIPVVVAMSGGYATDVDAIVTIHTNTIKEAARSDRCH